LESSQVYRLQFPLSKNKGELQHARVAEKLNEQFWENPERPPFCQIFKANIMRRVYIALAAVFLNMFLFSCTQDDVADTEMLYHMVATEGDDENPPPPPPPPPPPVQ
jgi:hypothetical protein